MIQDIKKLLSNTLLKESFIYTFFNLINKVIPFLLLPILISYVGVKGFGYYSVFMTLSIIFGHFAGLNIQSVIHRRFFSKSEIDFPVYVFNGFLLIVFSSIITFIVSLIFSSTISKIIGVEIQIIFWAVLVAMLNNFIKVLLNIFRVENRPLAYGLVVSLQGALVFTISILLLMHVNFGWEATVIGQVISGLIFASATLIYLFKSGYCTIKFHLEDLVDALKYVVPLLPHGVSGVTFNLSGRLFVSSMDGVEATGLYTVAFQLASVVSLVCTAFSLAWTNWLFGQLKGGAANNHKIIKATYIYFVLALVFGFVYSLGIPSIATLILDPDDLGGIYYFKWLVAGFVMQGAYQVVVGYLFYDGKTGSISKITVSVALISLALNYFLVSSLSGAGAAISFFISWLIMFLATLILVLKNDSSPWKTNRVNSL